MRKPSCAWDSSGVRHHAAAGVWHFSKGGLFSSEKKCLTPGLARLAWCQTPALLFVLAGCAVPQYAVRPTPVPEESPGALEIERTISAVQAEEFAQQGARPVGATERVGGFVVQRVVDRLSRVTERPALRYRAYLYRDQDPNAAALADGRIYLSTGLLSYLASRSPSTPLRAENELAFILGHELAHTVAQHLVKRYRALQQQELIFAVAAAGAAAITRGGSETASRVALQAVSLAREAVNSTYSQQDELEADQLGIQYVIRAGYDPSVALDLLTDFARFDNPWPFLRTHPYILTRREYLARYLADTGRLPSSAGAQPVEHAETTRAAVRDERAEQTKRLQDAQRLYPPSSVSWTNLQRQIDALEADGRYPVVP
ncbi:MAG: hypothetical protein A3B78_02505 [Omnitrophica WOR_2 bacterium RIFCSPHIGHO2_02_FULL_67_20]|nr:MAG: hypothetical protein A3B78_02505 [Omnitrophica WOR_2 bacterium RIFCSPHIGHO2_02_FULL_67_20]